MGRNFRCFTYRNRTGRRDMSFHGHFDDHDERLVFTSPDILRRFRGKHILSVSQFSRQDLEDYIFPMADTCRETLHKGGEFSTLRGKVVTLVFYEPSTRTHQSFSTAASLLGAITKDIVGMQFSSVSRARLCRIRFALWPVTARPSCCAIRMRVPWPWPLSTPNAQSSTPETARASIPRRRCWTCTPFDVTSAASTVRP